MVSAQVQGFILPHWPKLHHMPMSEPITLGGTWRWGGGLDSLKPIRTFTWSWGWDPTWSNSMASYGGELKFPDDKECFCWEKWEIFFRNTTATTKVHHTFSEEPSLPTPSKEVPSVIFYYWTLCTSLRAPATVHTIYFCFLLVCDLNLPLGSNFIRADAMSYLLT